MLDAPRVLESRDQQWRSTNSATVNITCTGARITGRWIVSIREEQDPGWVRGDLGAHLGADCLRCRGLRSAGLDAGPAAADEDDDDDEECKPMPGPTSPPTCLSRSRDSFSARSRSSRFMIFFSRVLDIAPRTP